MTRLGKKDIAEYIEKARARNELPILQDKSLVTADLCGMDLRGVAFVDCSLSTARFNYSDVSYADFRGSALLNTSFIGAKIEYANFAGVNLTDADFRNAVGIETANFEGAKINNAIVDLKTLLTLLGKEL